MAIFDSTFRDYVMGAPSPVRDVSGAPPEHDAAMMDAYAGALGLLDSAEREHADAQARGDALAAQSAAQRAQHARAQLDNLTTAYSKRGAGNAHEAARMATTPHQPMQSRPSVPTGKDRTSSAGAATEEGDPFRQWLESQGLSGGISSAGQGGRSRDYMEEMQQILMAYGGMGYSPSFAGEGIAAQGERAGVSDALRAQEAENNAARTNAYLQSQERQAETGALRLEGEEKKRAAAEARFGRTQAEVERHNKAVEEAAAAERARRAAAGLAGKDAKAAKDAEKKEAQGWKDVTELRKEFNAQPIVKSFGTQRQEFEKMKSAASNPSAAGDLMLIFSLMKILDPNSSVRESEAASASNAGGVPERVRNQWNNALSGQRLTPEQRQDFVTQATRIFQSAKSQYDEQTTRYRDLAAKIGGDPDDVVKIDAGGGTKASGLVKVRQKSTGATKTLSADAAKRYLADPDFEEVK